MANYFEAVSLPELEVFMKGRQKNKPLSMKRGKKFHDHPITTRRTGDFIDSDQYLIQVNSLIDSFDSDQ